MSGRESRKTIRGRFLDELALGLIDGGCQVATNYPGFRSNELSDFLGCDTTSVDEKNALAVAWGASLGGKRSVATFKNVGLNDAADPFLNAMVLGVNAGLVIVVFDDIDVEHSQLRMDSRPYIDFLGGLWLEPSDATRAYELGRVSLCLSERFSVPVVIRVTNILSSVGRAAERRPLVPCSRSFKRDPGRWVIHPVNAAAQEEDLRRRNGEIQSWADMQSPVIAPGETQRPIHVSVGGREPGPAKHPEDSFVEVYPLSESWLDALRRSDRRIHVWERGGPYVAGKIREAISSGRVDYSPKSPVLGRWSYRVTDQYENLFSAIRKLPNRFVAGDLGTYTMDTHRTIDACLCYGCSVGVATGFALANPRAQVVCVTGDGAFFHSGKSAVLEAAARGLSFTVVVFDNGGCRGTGGQAIPGDFAFASENVDVVDVDYPQLSENDHHDILANTKGRPGIRVVRMRAPF